jgi:acetyl-CoA synthetase
VLVIDAQNAPAAVAVRERLAGLVVASVGTGVAGADRDLDALIDSGETPGAHPTQLGDPATIMYTSGTSGAPKGCVIPHRGLVCLAPFVRHALGLAPGEVMFSTADTGWSFGLFTTGLAPLGAGATRLLYEGGFDASRWWEVAREHGATHLASAPTGFRQLAAAGRAAMGEAPLPVRAATSAGEPLTHEVVDWFAENAGFTIYDSYGLTELGMLVANLRDPGSAPPVAGSMGVAVPGYDIRLCDEDGAEVAHSEPGRLAVRDDGWLLGIDYWGRTDEWQARLRDGWWFTEDLVRQDDEGRYWYVGRADDVIVTAGYNVGPSDVENALLEHPAIVDAACVGAPDERKGQTVAAHVVLREGADAPPLDEVRAWVGERVGWHAAPRSVRAYVTLPRTASGKVIRRALRDGTWTG